MTLNNIQ